MKRYKLFIDNEWRAGSENTFLETRDPAKGETIAELECADAEQVDDAVNAARKAFKSGVWSDLDGNQRAEYMLRAAKIMQQRHAELAKWEARDTGKPIFETEMIDIPISVQAMTYFANKAREIEGQVIPLPGDYGLDWVSYEPYGVVATITPWNFPLHLATRCICPALAAGNTVVHKSSSLAPVTPTILGEIFLEAGFPAGVLNIVNGPGNTTGEALISHSEVQMVSFTGSLEVGRRVLECSARSPIIKKVLLELGGKGPLIAEADCDIDGAVNSLIKGFCLTQGEVCCASTRLFLHENIYQEFMDRLVARVESLKIGDPLDPETRIGSLITPAHLHKVDGYIKEAVAQGAKLACGGEIHTVPPCPKGSFYKPTILTDVDNQMRCAQEEIFGPVLVVIKYNALDDAIEMANDSQYALAASVWSENMKTLLYAAKKIDAGVIWLNENMMAEIQAPYGGNKNSGLGREYGTYGLMEYLKIKNNVLYTAKEYANFYDF